MLLSDSYVSTDQGDYRVQTECSGEQCSLTAPGQPTQVQSLSDYRESISSNTGSLDTTSSPADMQRGVTIVEYAARLTVGSGDAETVAEEIGIGGWIEHSYFQAGDVDLGAATIQLSLSIGEASGSNPVSGSATWTGAMVGTDIGAAASRPALVRGDADVTVADFNNPRIDVTFTNVRNVNGGGMKDDMNWNGLELTLGRFKEGSDGDSIQGTFYGPNHQEVGGIFERNEMIGAFGASR
ncbi:MAG: transferrin-binding protein-like solute binding protein [Rhodobacteraceae bacterium]|nr:transferrin-binding protein-like solute binding protein [Paracoccaceae bacterium]